MDLSDASKLLRLGHLNKVLESLSYNEDSNAKDSFYTKSTTMDSEELLGDPFTLFGESLKSADTPSCVLGAGRRLENEESVASLWDFSPQDTKKHCFYVNEKEKTSRKLKN